MSVIIRLQGLPLSAASADIRNFFCGLRIPDGAVNIVGGEAGDAFIGFATDDDARQAMQKNMGRIHNTEIRLHLSSRNEMNEVIENARNVPPSFPPRFPISIASPRFEREEPPRFPPREDNSRYGRDAPPYGQFGEDHSIAYARGPINDNGRRPFGGFPSEARPVYGNDPRAGEIIEEIGGGDRKPALERSAFQIQPRNYGSEKIDERKSDEGGMGGQTAMWINQGQTNRMQKREGGYVGRFPHVRQEEVNVRICVPGRESISSTFGKSRDDRVKREGDIKEESWRIEKNRSSDRLHTSNGPIVQNDDPITFFGRGATIPRKTLLPVPSLSSPPSSIPPPQYPPVEKPKEEAFVELTRLPCDLLRPCALESFLSPSTPLTLSSVKVVYGPEGIHLSSLVRFTNAMDAFHALQKDGEQGVKIRPSTKEVFESARDGPPPIHLNPSIPPFHTVPPMGGMVPPGAPPPNLFTMPLINPNEVMMIGNDRREIRGGRNEMNDGRGDRRRREDSPSRGRRDDKRRRSSSPRSKKSRQNRICVHVSNLPFRVKETEIRRMLGPGLNPYAIKKIFNEDNSPSDVWIMEFSSEAEAIETVRRRMELGGRQARLRIVEEPEADRLLRQKFRSPPRRGEKEGERKEASFDQKVKMQQEAIEIENARLNGSGEYAGEKPLAGAFSTPIFTTNRGFMRGGRGGGRGMRGELRGSLMRGGRVRGGGIASAIGRENGERNCLLVSNMPPIPTPQILLEHLRIIPSQIVKCDQIAPDAAIIELRSEMDAIRVAENACGQYFPLLNQRKLIVAAMGRTQIDEEFNRRGAKEE